MWCVYVVLVCSVGRTAILFADRKLPCVVYQCVCVCVCVVAWYMYVVYKCMVYRCGCVSVLVCVYQSVCVCVYVCCYIS